MKLIFNDIGNGLCPYAPQKKCIDPLITASIIGAGSSLIGGLFSGSQQNHYTEQQMRLQSKLNKQEMATSHLMQRGQQEWLMNKQYGAAVGGMRGAGLNPATANGTSPSVPSASSPSTGSSGPSAGMAPMDLARSASEIALLKSEIDLNKAKAKEAGSHSDNLNENTNWLKFQNSQPYKDAIMRGMNADILKATWQASESESNVKVNEAKVLNIAEDTKRIAAVIGLTNEQQKNLAEDTAKKSAEIKLIMAKIPTEMANQVYLRAAAKAQKAAARNYVSMAKLNERRSELDLPWYEKEDMMQGTLLKQEQTKGQSLSNVEQELENQLAAYYKEVQTSYGVTERAFWDIVGHITHALSPLGSFMPSIHSSTSYVTKGPTTNYIKNGNSK